MTMDRRRFLSTTTASLAAALAADTPKRVGLIGCGWYGMCDLLRLIQVAPVEVVALCDVDEQMLADAAETITARQLSKKTPRTHGDYRQMLKERDLDVLLIGTPDCFDNFASDHARPGVSCAARHSWARIAISAGSISSSMLLVPFLVPVFPTLHARDQFSERLQRSFSLRTPRITVVEPDEMAEGIAR